MRHNWRRFGRGATALTVLLLAAGGCAWIERVSVDTQGGDSNGGSGTSGIPVSISGDGRYVAFQSLASDLVPGDGNATDDVFRRDVLAGTTSRVSVDAGGGDPDRNSNNPSISADGRYVAFTSSATDLVPGDGNGFTDVFVRDLRAGTTTLVSVDVFGGDSNFGAERPSISADGRFVAFQSLSIDLVPGDRNGLPDVFVRDLQTATTTRVSVDAGGLDPNGGSVRPSISADGRYVAFDSSANDLVPGDGNSTLDVFRRDVLAGTTTRVSVDTSGGDPDQECTDPSISADGRYVAFDSFASDLVPGDGNSNRDIFQRDVQAGTTSRVSVDTGGADPNGYSDTPSISGDGRYVAFHSLASDLIAADSNGTEDVFVRDRVLGRTVRVSQDLRHGQASGASINPEISGDGRYVAFQSNATNLVSDDANSAVDIFLKYARVVTVTAMTPDGIARRPGKVPVTITGNGFEPGSTVHISRSGSTISVENVKVVNDGEISALISVPSDSEVGTYDIRVDHPPTVLGTAKVAAGQCDDCLQVVA
jgi:Tol biopolymer transport system component